jgi:selenocysteine-specific elongation factor
MIYPSSRRVRIRGLQQHGQAVEVARPGSRTAINLSGIERQEVGRGDVLALTHTLSLSRRLDVRLQVLKDAPGPLRHRSRLLLYHGTSEVVVDVVLLEADALKPGESGWAQLYVARPLPSLPGDRFILRRPAPAATVAGGVIVDAAAARHRRRDPSVLESLRLRARPDPNNVLAAELARHPGGASADELARRLGMDAGTLQSALSELVGSGKAAQAGGTILSAAAWENLRSSLLTELATYHRDNPLRTGMAREELKTRLRIKTSLNASLLSDLIRSGQAVESGPGEVALSGHRPQLSAGQKAAVEAALGELEAGRFSPPGLSELTKKHALTLSLVQYLVQQGLAVRLDDETMLAAGAYREALATIQEHLKREGKITVAQARDLLGSSRRYVLPLLEYLDAQRVTRRLGDDRILRG